MLPEEKLFAYRMAAESLNLGPSPPAIVLNLLDHIDALDRRVLAHQAALDGVMKLWQEERDTRRAAEERIAALEAVAEAARAVHAEFMRANDDTGDWLALMETLGQALGAADSRRRGGAPPDGPLGEG